MQVFKKVQRDKLTSNVILRNIMTLTTYELIWQWTTFSPSAVSFSFNQVFYSDLPLSSFLKETWLWTPKLFFFLVKALKDLLQKLQGFTNGNKNDGIFTC